MDAEEYFAQFNPKPRDDVISLGIFWGPGDDKYVNYQLSQRYILAKNQSYDYTSETKSNAEDCLNIQALLLILEKKCEDIEAVYYTYNVDKIYEVHLPNDKTLIWSSIMTTKILTRKNAYLDPQIVNFIKRINLETVKIPPKATNYQSKSLLLKGNEEEYKDENYPLVPYLYNHEKGYGLPTYYGFVDEAAVMLIIPTFPEKLSPYYFSISKLRYADVLFGIALTPELARNIEEVYFLIDGLYYYPPRRDEDIKLSPHGLQYFPVSYTPITLISCPYSEISIIIKFINPVQDLPRIYLYLKNYYCAKSMRCWLMTNAYTLQPYKYNQGCISPPHNEIKGQKISIDH